MNSLTKADVFAEDKLFATLDTTVRKVVVKNMPFLLTDTVGFIRKLPTQLIDSFKSTLTEITEADLLIHVIDISHPNYQDHINSVNFILSEIEAHEKPILMVFNKTDKFLNDNEMIKDEFDIEYEDKSLDRTKLVLSKEYNNRAYFISALNKTDINKLKDELYKKVREIHVTRFPYNAFLYPDIN
jgi:GTP-binding protein HflX